MNHSSLFYICVSSGSASSQRALDYWSNDLKNHHHLILTPSLGQGDLSTYQFKNFHPFSFSLNFMVGEFRQRHLNLQARRLARKRAQFSKLDRILFPYPLPRGRRRMLKVIEDEISSIADLDGLVVAFADEESLLLARKLAVGLNAKFSGDLGIIGRLRSGEGF